MKLNPGIKVELAFGVGFDKHNMPINRTWASLSLNNIINHATRQFGGCTLIETEGDWINSAGKHCRENGRMLVVYFMNDEGQATQRIKITDLVDVIKRDLDQEAVCVTVSQVTTAIL